MCGPCQGFPPSAARAVAIGNRFIVKQLGPHRPWPRIAILSIAGHLQLSG